MHRVPNKSKDSQSGFSALILILITILVLAAGAVFWYVWHQNQNIGDNTQTSISSQEFQNQPQDTAQLNDSAENEKYLVIEEWGVQLPLGDLATAEEVTYEYIANRENGISAVSFKVPKGSELEYCMNIHIDRESADRKDGSALSGFPIIAEYDGYLYYERRNNSFCDAEDSSRTRAAESLMDELSNSMRSLKKID